MLNTERSSEYLVFANSVLLIKIRFVFLIGSQPFRI